MKPGVALTVPPLDPARRGPEALDGPKGDGMAVGVLSHSLPGVFFVALAWFVTYPLGYHLVSGVIGRGAGDNVTFLWSFWRAEQATAAEFLSFQTPLMFAPLGTSLALHTGVPLLAGLSALVPQSTPVVSYNVAVMAAVALNGLCAYAAAWCLTRDRLAATFAGVTFACAPFLLVRLQGHLNVLSAWGLPLVVALLVSYHRRPAAARAACIGAALAATAYVDYYALVFAAILTGSYLILAGWRASARRSPLGRGRAFAFCVVAILLVAVTLAAAAIELTGGTQTHIAGIRVSMRSSFNLRVAAGLLAASAALLWWWPQVTVRRLEDSDPRLWRGASVGIAACGILILPLIVAGMRLFATGDYVSQQYRWRSAPSGIDIASLFFGNPMNRWTGRWSAGLYDRFGIDPVESVAWLGLAPIALAAYAVLRRRSMPEVRPWLWIGLLFFVWALGPYLMLFGQNSGLMLPQTVLRYVPIVNNARIPARAFVVVLLTVALLGAVALSRLRAAAPWRGTAIACLAIAAVLVDFWPAPHAIFPLQSSFVYSTLGHLPRGVLMEIPFGVGDGNTERGHVDHLSLYYQTIHGQPQVGGVLARLSPRIRSAYDSDPIFARALALAEGTTPARPQVPCVDSLACSVRYVIVNDATARPELIAFVQRTFDLRFLQRDRERTLSEVASVPACACRGGQR